MPTTTYFRFVTFERHPQSDEPMGVFSALYKLQSEGKLEPHELVWFRKVIRWFNNNLEKPDRLSGSRKPNAPDRAILWFRSSATEHLSRMHELCSILEHKDIVVEVLKTDTPGYVVYEDEFQVATIPFN